MKSEAVILKHHRIDPQINLRFSSVRPPQPIATPSIHLSASCHTRRKNSGPEASEYNVANYTLYLKKKLSQLRKTSLSAFYRCTSSLFGFVIHPSIKSQRLQKLHTTPISDLLLYARICTLQALILTNSSSTLYMLFL